MGVSELVVPYIGGLRQRLSLDVLSFNEQQSIDYSAGFANVTAVIPGCGTMHSEQAVAVEI